MAFRSDTESASTGTSINPGLPAGALSTDVLIATLQTTDASATFTPPSGWTLIRETDDTDALYSTTISYWALGNVASTTFGISGASNKRVWIGAFSGRNTSSPITISAGQHGGATTSTAPSIVAVSGDDVVATVHSEAISGAVGAPWTSRSALTQHRVGTQDGVSAGATSTMTASNAYLERFTGQQIAIAASGGVAATSRAFRRRAMRFYTQRF